MQEQFSYSLMASGLGILIVFSILVLLSCLMVLIKKLSDSNANDNKSDSRQASVVSGAPSDLPLSGHFCCCGS